MLKKMLYILLTWVFSFLILNSWTKLVSDDFTPSFNKKIIVSQYDSLQKREIANYFIDIKNESVAVFTWSYNSWSIINELDTKENYKILHSSKYNFDWAFYTYKSSDWKYLIFVARSIIRKYWIKFHLWWWSLYILELKTWKIKQIYIENLNNNNKYINRIIWIW